ncbi:hypothetical protein [Bernardetia sp. MNP-M8]|uniref:hypothetical protein n=1 Tax=Bernardetia sp. MNP-M8 TaxID=3127470 RepID=UPI0030CF4842
MSDEYKEGTAMIEKLLVTLENALKLEEDKLISIVDEIYYPVNPNTHLFISTQKLKYQIRDIGYILDDKYMRGEFDSFKKKSVMKGAKLFYESTLSTKSCIKDCKETLSKTKNRNK